MGDPNLKEIHEVLLDVAKKAGQMIVSANPSTVDTKKNCTLPTRGIDQSLSPRRRELVESQLIRAAKRSV